jgi:HlyD family secretion protein
MLLDKDYVAKVDLEHAQQALVAARNGYDTAKTQMERDQVNLNYAKIFSPIDGMIISQEITLGQTVAASFQAPTMYKIAGDLTKMKIDVNLSEADISKIKAGMPVIFTVDTFGKRLFDGKIDVVNLNPNNMQGGVTYTVVVAVNNPEKLLLPGMTAYVSITLSEQKNVLRVPSTALRFTPPVQQESGGIHKLLSFGMHAQPVADNPPAGGPNGKILYLLKDNNTLVPVAANVGVSDESYVEISGTDIAEGATVVTGIKPVEKN